MNANLAKILIAVGVLGAFLVLGKSLYYAPNDEVDSGLEISETVGGAAVVASSQTGKHIAATKSALSSNTSASVNSALPSRLHIPKIGVDAKVQHLGVTRSGNMAAPSNFSDVGWYKLGTIPGKIGSAVISGHEDDAIATPAVFYNLNKLAIGDDVYVTDKNGNRLHFRVVDKKIVPYNLKGPELNAIFTRADKARLNLITCAGDWLPSAKTNDQRLVVYTELVK